LAVYPALTTITGSTLGGKIVQILSSSLLILPLWWAISSTLPEIMATGHYGIENQATNRGRIHRDSEQPRNHLVPLKADREGRDDLPTRPWSWIGVDKRRSHGPYDPTGI
jgi:hypothetical protein